MFGLCLSFLVILVLLYKGSTNIVELTEPDGEFLRSDSMKWVIIMLAVILVIGTMFDLYFSLVVRTFYLTKLYYPDIQSDDT